MVQLEILSGKKAGTRWVARRLPVHVGRSAPADLCLEESGVWDRHLELHLDPSRGFVLAVQRDTLATVNGQPVTETVLHNGDYIDIGSAKLRFWLGETRQGGLRKREWFTWTALAAITAGQLALIYWLLR
jgi:pSer/pThr/pTyr-binding forkhead associated (FHA) protein